MSYPQALICYDLEDNRAVLVLVVELPLAHNRTILANPMHTVDTTKHPGKPRASLMAI